MTGRRSAPSAVALLLTLAAAACGGSGAAPEVPPYDPYSGTPPLGTPILQIDAPGILGASGWTWVPFADSLCNDPTLVSGSYQFSTSTTGLAINWGTVGNTDLVFLLQGGGACWDFATCGGLVSLGAPLTATTGPFGPTEFAGVYAAYTNSWLNPAALRAVFGEATIVFVPYCTGDIHGGDRVTTYTNPPEVAAYVDLPAITWHHAGHANVMAFLKRLGATFPSPSKVVVAGSSAGGFGALANYPAFKWYWPQAKSYLIDDSGPPLAGNAIPASTRAAWYSSWDLGASLDAFCPGCRADMSEGLTELTARYPDDRIALISHLQDLTIREFFGTFSYSSPYLTPMPAATFEADLRALGTNVMDPTSNAKFFFTNSPVATAHPALDDPTVIATPAPGLNAWLTLMLTDNVGWGSLADP